MYAHIRGEILHRDILKKLLNGVLGRSRVVGVLEREELGSLFGSDMPVPQLFSLIAYKSTIQFDDFTI